MVSIVCVVVAEVAVGTEPGVGKGSTFFCKEARPLPKPNRVRLGCDMGDDSGGVVVVGVPERKLLNMWQ